MPVRVHHNITKIMAKVDKDVQRGVELATKQFVQDANEYVRLDTGATRDSAYVYSQYKLGKGIWSTDYVREIYFTGVPRRELNPRASLMWAHKAAQENIKKYSDIIKKGIKGG